MKVRSREEEEEEERLMRRGGFFRKEMTSKLGEWGKGRSWFTRRRYGREM